MHRALTLMRQGGDDVRPHGQGKQRPSPHGETDPGKFLEALRQ
jgi:hypothetical protein